MVMGNLSHNVEIVFEKGKFEVACSCRWKQSCPTRRDAFARAHLHVAQSQIGE